MTGENVEKLADIYRSIEELEKKGFGEITIKIEQCQIVACVVSEKKKWNLTQSKKML